MARKIDRNERKREVVNYVKDQIKEGHYPSYKELDKNFRIRYHKIKPLEIYLQLGFNILNFPLQRPNGSKKIVIKELIKYIKQEYKKKHFPTKRELQNKFKLRTDYSIKELYKKAGVKYKQANSQELKNKKAKLLTKIIINKLDKLNLKLIKYGKTQDRGIDILTKDNKDNFIGIEIKAHNKHEPIKNRNINQIKKYFTEIPKIKKFILITTTDKIYNNFKIPNNLEIIFFKDLLKICNNKKDLKMLNYIRNESIHQKTKEHLEKKKVIIDYVKKLYENNEEINMKKIENKLNIGIMTYFESLYDIYEQAKIKIPFNKIKHIKNKNRRDNLKKELINASLNYIKEEVRKGHYPSGIDIQKKFKVGPIWRYTKTTYLYKKLGLLPYHERVKSKLNTS